MAATAWSALGSTPGPFFSFLTAFLMADEPAKRLARLNIDLNSQLVGARDAARGRRQPGEPNTPTTSKPALKLGDARIELRDDQLRLSAGRDPCSAA